MDADDEDKHQHQSNPFSISIDIDIMWWIILAVSITTRFWYLEVPPAIVFDELIFGNFAAMYQAETFFFDLHPPLGKLLIGAGGYIGGYKGNFTFDKIGTAYPSPNDVWWLRVPSAIAGSLLPPIAYSLTQELQMGYLVPVMAAILIVMDNALLVQSRFMLIDIFLLFFLSLATLAFLRVRSFNCISLYSASWWFWMIVMSISATAATLSKYVATYTVLLLLVLSLRHFYKEHLPGLSLYELACHVVVRMFCFVLLPFLLYTSIFYVHLHILRKGGHHAATMSSAFQASLSEGLTHITEGQPSQVAYGSQVTLRTTSFREPCWLHSHAHVYPVRYPDGRGSSHQQQVTCYTYKDVNNWWVVKRPGTASLLLEWPPHFVQHGVLIQLVHGTSQRLLNSHDVAAAMSPHHQEVSGYIDYNISVPSQNLWRVEVVGGVEGDTWHAITSQIRLVHVNTSAVLRASGRQLPEWGFHQHEIITDSSGLNYQSADWNVEEHRYSHGTNLTPVAETTESRKNIELWFWAKFLELQSRMLLSPPEDDKEHYYSSSILDWPLVSTNLAYWADDGSTRQIHLLPNPLTGISGTVCVLLNISLLVFYLLRRQRGCFDIEYSEWTAFCGRSEILLGGYIVNMLPYVICESTLFLHHYLPALLFLILLIPSTIYHLHFIARQVPLLSYLLVLCALVWLVLVMYTFVRFLPFTYGSPPLSRNEIDSLMWSSTWNFILPS